MIFILICKIGEKYINCYDGTYDKDTLKSWSKKGILKCPYCGKQYTYNHGKIRIPYFKHLNSDCSIYGEPETEEHISGKIDIYEWLKLQNDISDIVLEGWLPDTKQRPDIMFKYKNKQFVIEYQCSPIASEYIKRHELYQALGINDIWICGTEKYIGENKRLNTLEKNSGLYYDSKNKMFYIVDKLSNRKFDEIADCFLLELKNKPYCVIEDIINYNDKCKNYLIIKDFSNNYKCIGYRWLSPTGRPSRKYRYPEKEYKYIGNYSIASCYKINEIKFETIYKQNILIQRSVLT